MSSAGEITISDEARVRVLPSEVIDRIAAGEVIERPASVVKELVENAVDAGARAVRVTLADGGLTRIVVEDDGRGMSRTDARTCLMRHATSKLGHADDLFAIRTLGFRGEALSSIAAISRMTVTTRRAADVTAVRVISVGGEVASIAEVGAPVGTCVEVEDLFFNTPARRKFMRSPATEQAHAVEWALRVILGASECGIVVTSGERRLLDVPEDASDTTRMVAALGARVERVFPFALEHESVRVSGYITDPEVNRSDAKGMWFFVNGRYVRDRMLQRAVLDGYRALAPPGRYPVCVIHIEIAADAVDVNVHPQKLEVRFSDGQAVFRALSAALTGTLAATPWIQGTLGARAATEAFFERNRDQPYKQWTYSAQAYAPSLVREAAMAEAREAALPRGNLELPLSSAGRFTSLKVLGQLLGQFLVCEGVDEMILVDVKAAHAELALGALRGDPTPHQLLFPETTSDPRLARAQLAPYGFDVEPIGPGQYIVRAVPEALREADPMSLVDAALAALDTGGDVLAALAAHAAPTRDTRALLAALDEHDVGAAVRRLTRDELTKLF